MISDLDLFGVGNSVLHLTAALSQCGDHAFSISRLDSTRSVSGRMPSSVDMAERPLYWDSSPCLTEIINRFGSLSPPPWKPLGKINPIQPMSAGLGALYNSLIGDRHN